MELNLPTGERLQENNQHQDANTCPDNHYGSPSPTTEHGSLFTENTACNRTPGRGTRQTLGNTIGMIKNAIQGKKPQAFPHTHHPSNTDSASVAGDNHDAVEDFSFVDCKECSSTPTRSPGALGFLLPTISHFSEASVQSEVEDKAPTYINWHELGPNVLWRRHFFNTVGSLFWKDYDLEKHEKTTYQSRIQMDPEAIKNELHYICRMGYVNRLQALCDYICRQRHMNLTHQTLYGDQFGETALHTALTFNQIGVAEILVEFGGRDLLMKQYEHPQYAGMTALHLAVVKGQLPFIQYMLTMLEDVDRQTLLHTQATGWFLRQNFHASGLPLTLAAWTGRSDIVETLVGAGAEPDRQESGTGNNMLHSLVEYSLYEPQAACNTFQALLNDQCVIRKLAQAEPLGLEKISELDSARIQSKLVKQEDANGFTPLTLACRLGAMEMVDLILNLKNIYRYPQWEYGPAVMEYFDVSEMTSYIRCNRKMCGMELLAYACGSPGDKSRIYSKQPIKRLTKVLWTAYKPWFLFLGIYHIVTMIIFTMCALQLPDQDGLIGRLVRSGDIFVLVYAATMLLQDMVAMFFNVQRFFWQELVKRNDSLYHIPWSALRGFRSIMFLFALLAVVWFLSRLLFSQYVNLIAAPALLLGWYYTMFFTRLFRDIGIFTSMLNRMVYGNLIYFCIAYGFVLIAFAGAFSCLVHTPTGKDGPPELQTIWTTSWSLMRFTVGLLDLDDSVTQLQSPLLARIILFFFIVISMVLLLNVLIAAMGDTYADIAGKKDDLWRKLKYEAVLLIEKRIPHILRPKIKLRRHMTYTSHGKPQQLWLLQVETVKKNLEYHSQLVGSSRASHNSSRASWTSL